MTGTRIVIAGGPRTGKTTLADKEGAAVPGLIVRHTDDLMHFGWSDASLAVSHWFDEPGPWLIEGVAAVRALRKWLDRHATGKPCDVVLFLEEPLVPLMGGQESMTKGVATVWREIELALTLRGVQVLYGKADKAS